MVCSCFFGCEVDILNNPESKLPTMINRLNTGFSDKLNPEIAKMIGIKGILMKPIVKSELAQTLRKVLDT